MNKLTADKAKQIIAGLKDNASYAGPSIRDEYMMQALEIALPILEQQERGEGWIEWGGGKCPVGNLFSDTAFVIEVECRAGNTQRSARADFYSWEHCDRPTDIIAYRIIPERATNQNGERQHG